MVPTLKPFRGLAAEFTVLVVAAMSGARLRFRASAKARKGTGRGLLAARRWGTISTRVGPLGVP